MNARGSTSVSNSSALAAAPKQHLGLLEDAPYEDLTAALSRKLEQDRVEQSKRLLELDEAEKRLEDKQRQLEGVEQRIFSVLGSADDVVELNVGGQSMSTTRAVLCSAEGSLLAGMFSGNFDDGIKRDKDGKFFLDVDPPLFAKVLSHLRLRRVASPDSPAPLPVISDDTRSEFDMMVKYFGLENFMYGEGLSGNVFERIADLTGAPQSRLQTHDVITITLSSTGGVPATNHEEVLSSSGFHERSLENSYGAHPNTITIKFKKHRVRVDAMELRAKAADVLAHMSTQWAFRHGTVSVNMGYAFTRTESATGRLDVNVGTVFADEVQWTFPKDFCLEHVILHGRVMCW